MLRNHFIAEKYLDKYFLFDYYNLLIIQVDEGLYNCAINYLSNGQSISNIEDVVNTSLCPYSEEIKPLLYEKLLISDTTLNCDIIKSYQKVYFSFPTIHGCNLNCKYCFAEAGLNYKDDNRIMSTKQIEKIYNFILSCDEYKNSNRFRLDFVSGGEPLLNFDLIKSAKNIGERVFGEHGKTFEIWVCTNGTLLDSEKARYLNEHGIGIGISLDGPKYINDMFRRYPDNTSSYIDTTNAIDKIINNKTYNRFFRDIWALTVVTSKTPSLVDILKHHKSLGINNVQMKFVRSTQEKGFTLTNENTNHFIFLYSELVDFIISNLKDDDVSYLKMILNGNDYLGKIIIRLILRDAAVYRCMAGRNKVCFTANGDIYPCDSFVGDESFKIGSISDGFYNGKVEEFYNQLVLNRPSCKNCWANILCGGDCYYNSYLKNGNIQQPDNSFCTVYRELCLMAIKLVAYISLEKPELFEHLYQYLEKRKAFQ